jgi:hypothetical protein
MLSVRFLFTIPGYHWRGWSQVLVDLTFSDWTSILPLLAGRLSASFSLASERLQHKSFCKPLFGQEQHLFDTIVAFKQL